MASRLNPSPFGDGATVRPGMVVPPARNDIHPRSLPEDRSEGNLNPDPNLEHGLQHTGHASSSQPFSPASNQKASGHAPSGEPWDDDGAGNPLPRNPAARYGLEDEEEDEMGAGRSDDRA